MNKNVGKRVLQLFHDVTVNELLEKFDRAKQHAGDGWRVYNRKILEKTCNKKFTAIMDNLVMK